MIMPKLKAFAVKYLDGYNESTKIYWAKTPGKAKAMAMGDGDIGDPDEFIDLVAHRIPWADGLKGLAENELILEELRQGWHFELTAFGGEDDTLSAEDLPMIQDMGGLNAVFNAYYNGHGLIGLREDYAKKRDANA